MHRFRTTQNNQLQGLFQGQKGPPFSSLFLRGFLLFHDAPLSLCFLRYEGSGPATR